MLEGCFLVGLFVLLVVVVIIISIISVFKSDEEPEQTKESFFPSWMGRRGRVALIGLIAAVVAVAVWIAIPHRPLGASTLGAISMSDGLRWTLLGLFAFGVFMVIRLAGRLNPDITGTDTMPFVRYLLGGGLVFSFACLLVGEWFFFLMASIITVVFGVGWLKFEGFVLVFNLIEKLSGTDKKTVAESPLLSPS